MLAGRAVALEGAGCGITRSAEDAAVVLLTFPTGGLAGSPRDGVDELAADRRGCRQQGAMLGDAQAAGTDPFSLSELNASRARGSNHSVNSLPGPSATCGSTQGSVVSWAESFETLLQDRVAVTYFTVSATA